MPKPRGSPAQPLATPSLGTWIRATRLSQGVSQRSLADRSGVSRSYLCDIERGRDAQPSVATLDKLAAALGASRADLLRAAGVLDPVGDPHSHEAEQRLLALYRDLSDSGRTSVERFARFMHREEHQWVQPQLIEIPEPDGANAPEHRSHQTGPTLFDELPAMSRSGMRIHGGTSPAGSGRDHLTRSASPDDD